jgi:hypothetical protein
MAFRGDEGAWDGYNNSFWGNFANWNPDIMFFGLGFLVEPIINRDMRYGRTIIPESENRVALELRPGYTEVMTGVPDPMEEPGAGMAGASSPGKYLSRLLGIDPRKIDASIREGMSYLSYYAMGLGDEDVNKRVGSAVRLATFGLVNSSSSAWSQRDVSWVAEKARKFDLEATTPFHALRAWIDAYESAENQQARKLALDQVRTMARQIRTVWSKTDLVQLSKTRAQEYTDRISGPPAPPSPPWPDNIYQEGLPFPELEDYIWIGPPPYELWQEEAGEEEALREQE